jgi:RNA polymerase sigma-70 factor (ECF subfamily)
MEKMSFEEVYRRNYERIYKAVYLRLLQREDTEDIVADTFIKAYQAYDRFDPEVSSAATWLNRIAMNTLYDHLRREQRNPVGPMAEDTEYGAEDPELLKLTDGAAQELYPILKRLKSEERELLMLRYGWELSYREIAEETGGNEVAVAKRVERLLKKCREYAG